METETAKGKLIVETESSDLEGVGGSLGRAKKLHSVMYRPSQLRKVAEGRRPGISLPYYFMNSPEITRGIAELDNFGFRTNVIQMDPTRTFVMTGHRKQSGFHVSDLWSQKQQQEFLKRLRLERAQFARERQVSFVNYLIQNKKKLFTTIDPAGFSGHKSQSPSQAYETLPSFRYMERTTSYPSPIPMTSTRSLSELPLEALSSLRSPMPSRDKPVSLKAKKRLSKVEGLITHCTSTLLNLKKSSKALAKSVKISKHKKEPLFEADSDDIWHRRSDSNMSRLRKPGLPLIPKRPARPARKPPKPISTVSLSEMQLKSISKSPSQLFINSTAISSPGLFANSPDRNCPHSFPQFSLPFNHSPGEVFEHASMESSQELFSSWDEGLKVSTSMELMERLNRLDHSIRMKVEQTYISTRQVDEEALRTKVLEMEKVPRKCAIAKRSEGLEYEKGFEEFKGSFDSRKRHKRRINSVLNHTYDISKWKKIEAVGGKGGKNAANMTLKSRKTIQKDFQKTQQQSFQFLKSAQSLSKQLSQCFLRAPVLRPHSKAFLVLSRGTGHSHSTPPE